MDLPTMKKHMQEELPALQTELDTIEKHLLSLDLPSHPNNTRAGISLLDKYREDLHVMVDQHFDNLNLSYLALCATMPCKETIETLKDYIEDTKKQLKTYKEKATGELTEHDIQSFKNKRFSDKTRKLEDMLNVLAVQKINVTFDEPEIILNQKVYSRLYHTLCEYITTSLYHNMNEQKMVELQNKLLIDQTDYFVNPDRTLPTINDEQKTLSLYSLLYDKTACIELGSNGEIPYSPSLIITPDSGMYVVGGVLNDGKLTNKVFRIQTEKLYVLGEVANMIVKKVAHSLCFINSGASGGGFIFSIGGRTNDGVRTKICEKYDILANKWHKIALMNSARSRAAVCPFDDNQIYAFYGTGSDMLNVTSCERYDLKLDRWTRIEVYNDFTGFEVSFAGAVQINSKQILVFGGFSENEQEKGSVNLSRRMVTFNVNNLTFRTHGEQLPLDFCLSLSSTPIIDHNEIYCLGFFLKSLQPQTTRYLDCDYVLRIAEDVCEVKNLVIGERRKKETTQPNI